MADRHETNLESTERITAELAAADAQLADAQAADPVDEPRLRMAQAAKVHAELVADSHHRTMALLASEYPGFEIGEPRATRERSVAALKADGIVGIYRAKGA